MNEEVKINPPAGGKKSLLFIEVGLIEATLIFLALFLIFAILNYFNIVSLSQLYPNKLGWLPHRALTQKTINFPQSSPNNQVNNQQSPTSLSCPLSNDLCSQGKLVSDQETAYQGLGFAVPENTSVLAPFSGMLNIDQLPTLKDKKVIRVMAAKLTAGDYTAVFYYPSEDKTFTKEQLLKLTKNLSVNQGDKLFTIDKGIVAFYPKEGFNLSFYVFKGKDDLYQTRIPLKPESLGKKIDLNSYK